MQIVRRPDADWLQNRTCHVTRMNFAKIFTLRTHKCHILVHLLRFLLLQIDHRHWMRLQKSMERKNRTISLFASRFAFSNRNRDLLNMFRICGSEIVAKFRELISRRWKLRKIIRMIHLDLIVWIACFCYKRLRVNSFVCVCFISGYRSTVCSHDPKHSFESKYLRYDER